MSPGQPRTVPSVAEVEISTEPAEMVTITGTEPAEVFAAATQWLREHQKSVSVFGVDFDYDPLDGDGAPEVSPYVLRLTYLRS